MKTFIFSFVCLFFLSQQLLANNGYEQAMKKGIEDLYQAKSPEAINQSANYFERIAVAEPEQWLPKYYAAYTRITLGAMEQSDEQLDLAQKHLDQVTEKISGDSELLALQGYLHMIRVALDPANRGPQLAPQTMQTLSQAVQMDPENPRALMLLAQMQYGTAQFFKSDTQEACQMMDQALVLFDKQETDGSLLPAWGTEIAKSVQKQCGDKRSEQ